MERPLLIPLASLIAGLCTADLCGSFPPSWTLAALLVTSFVAAFLKSRLPFLVSLALLFFVWGQFSLLPFLQPTEVLSKYLTETPVLIEGVVDERPVGTDSGARLLVQVERLYLHQGESAVAGRLLVHVKEGRVELCTGDRILFSSKIRKPRKYGLPGETDYPRRLAYQRVFATGFVAGGDDLVLLRAGEGWRHRIDQLAAFLGSSIREHAPGPEGGVLKALLLGDKSDVPEELNQAYARGGVNHILSISGFHVGIIFLCIFHLLYLMTRGSEFLTLHFNLRKTLLFAALPVVVFYLFLSGAAPATVRSVLMISALVAALQLKREIDPVNAVMVAACAILFAAPETLFEVSFQLSFLAIWGLVVLAPPVAAVLGRLYGALRTKGTERTDRTKETAGAAGRAAALAQGMADFVRWISLLLAASVAAVLATLVPVAYHFHQISVVGLVANLVVVPLMGYGAVVAGFASLPLLAIAPVPADWLLRFAAWLVGLSNDLILYLARAPVLSGYAPSGVDLLLACLVLCSLTFLGSKRARHLAVLALLMALVVRAAPAGGAGVGVLRVTFLSVGQGDAALVALPDGKWMLVDGGGRAGDTESWVGQRLLLPALRRLGVERLDYLVLSHEHPDHLQGVLFLAQHFEVGEFWESGVPCTLAEYRKLKWLLHARGIPVRALAGAAPFAAGGVQVEALWPSEADCRANQDANDSSLVLRLRYGQSSVLFTGDLGAEAEGQLLARRVPLDCTLLKVAHHGSKYSSTEPFLAAAAPKAAVISVGYRNPFHLPAPSTLDRLKKQGIPGYRTDLDGSVQALCWPDGRLTLSTPWGAF